MRRKEIIIRNPEALEDYLGVDIRAGAWRRLRHLDLRRNRHVKGVRALLAKIPGDFDLHALARFHAETGLELRIMHHTAENEIRIYDRNGVYPRPFLSFGRPDAAAIFAMLVSTAYMLPW